MKIIQINLNHCEAAQDLLHQMTREQKADVVLICEPYKTKENGRWCCSKSNKSAIWTLTHPLQEINDQKEGFVRARINNIYIYSCYAPPSWPQEQYERMLDELVLDAEGKSPVVIGGDFNAWATEWGSRITNTRGRGLLEAIARLDITIANEGSALTYRKAGMGSVIDVTFVSNSLAQKTIWRVSEDYTHSDHQAVIIELRETKKRYPSNPTGPKWSDKKLDVEAFKLMLNDQLLVEGPANDLARQLTDI